MKIRKIAEDGESRELLLKEYFLNAYLIALLKQVGAETRRSAERDAEAAAAAQPVASQN